MINASEIGSYIAGHNGRKIPIMADVSITERCNHECYYCQERRGTNSMSLEDFQRVVNRLIQLGVRGVLLTGGEPTLNYDFDEICHWLESNEIPYGLSTNMSVPITASPNYVKVTLDAGSPETYRALHKVDTFNEVIENIGRYMEHVSQVGSKTKVGVQCITYNVRQIEEFYKAVQNMGVRFIQFRPVECPGENLDYTEMVARINELKRLDSTRVRATNYGLVKYHPSECYANWCVLSVNVHGEVVYCRCRPNEVVGSIFDENILEKLNTYKPDMAKCWFPCRLSGANKKLEELSNEIQW
jgi:molybdenum cofactor biosynthesis enzyme MoaA